MMMISDYAITRDEIRYPSFCLLHDISLEDLEEKIKLDTEICNKLMLESEIRINLLLDKKRELM